MLLPTEYLLSNCDVLLKNYMNKAKGGIHNYADKRHTYTQTLHMFICINCSSLQTGTYVGIYIYVHTYKREIHTYVHTYKLFLVLICGGCENKHKYGFNINIGLRYSTFAISNVIVCIQNFISISTMLGCFIAHLCLQINTIVGRRPKICMVFS